MGMRGCTLISILLVATAYQTRVQASCLEPVRLAHSAVSITRFFDDAERAVKVDVIGTSGTAWFLSPTMIVTAEHVSVGMMLTPQDWKTIDIRDGDDTRTTRARVARVMGGGAEKLAVIELQSEFPDARSAAIRTAPLASEDQVVTFAYSGGRPRVVGGRFVKYGDEGRFAGAALLELFDGDNRLVVDHGASGAPVYDCDARIAAVVTTVITQTFPGLAGRIRISTPWGTPNVLAVPIQKLKEYSEAR